MKGVPILTAVSDAVWEAGLVSAFERGDLGIVVVRRCVDLAELLALAATRTARAVLLSADLRRLDSEVVSRLSAAELAVLGVADPADEAAQRFLYQCGVPVVLPADAPAAAVAEAIARAVGLRSEASSNLDAFAYGDPARAMASPVRAIADPARAIGESAEPGREPGRVVAVWGPTGAPGRTSVALGLADELSTSGVATLLIDADTYGGAIAQALGLLEEAPGLVAAVRSALRGSLDVPTLAGMARDVGGGLRVLTGVVRTDRWPELPVDAFVRVLDQARRLVEVVVIDCGFCLEQDEELVYDTLAPRRNGLTLAALAEADLVLAVGAADPVGLARLVRGVDELRTSLEGVEPHPVITRVRRGPLPGDPAVEVGTAIRRHLGLEPTALIPEDRAGYDLALARARFVREVAPNSAARRAMVELSRWVSAQFVTRPVAHAAPRVTTPSPA